MSRFASYLREIRPTVGLALPITVGQLSQMLMGVTDTVMIGHAGTVPLAASAFGLNVFNVFFVVGIGLMIPVAIFVSRARGGNRPAECGEYLRHGLAVALVFGVAETAMMAALSFRLGAFGQAPEVLAAVNPFFVLLACSLVPVLVYLVLRQFAEALGRPWMPTLVILAGVGLNAALNWVFIFGNLGLPALGLTGAGISTLASRVIAALVIFIWLRRSRDPAIHEGWPKKWFGGYSSARFREMLRIGLPASGMLLFESSAFAFSGIMVGWLGAIPLAAHQIAFNGVSLAFMFPLGLSMAAGMRVSHAVGAGQLARCRPIAFGSIGLSVGLTGTFGVLFFLFGRTIAGWFVNDLPVIALATQLFVVAALFQVVDGTQVIGAAALRGISDVKVPVAITFAAYWLVALPLGYILGVRGNFGAVGIWMALALGLACAAIFLCVRFTRLTRS